jgi:hypothetical protein
VTGAVVFTGPTLSPEAAAALLPGATILPPARQGDVFRAVRDLRPVAVGLIDGVFLHEPAVWHREILWALSEGVHVFGAASMGALRAAELSSFGMRGVGRVFAAYRDGAWPGFADPFEDDDEVAVIHAPAELGAVALSDALVDLRDTLLAAEAAGLLAPAERDALFRALKALPFAARSYRALSDLAGTALPDARADRLRAWLPIGQVPCKRRDAEAMLSELVAFLRIDPPPFVPAFRFEHVKVWDDFVSAEGPKQNAEEELVLEELRLRPDEWQEVARAALGRLSVAAAEPTDAQARRAFDAFRAARGLARRADLDAWCADNAASPGVFGRLIRDEAALPTALAAPPAGLDTAIADHLRLTGRFAPLLRRAHAKQAALAGRAPPAAGPELDGALAWFAQQNNGQFVVVRNDEALAAAVWREYAFRRRNV